MMGLELFIEVLLFIILMGFSAFFSSSETAFFSLNPVQLEQMRRDDNSKLGLINPYKLGKYRGYALLFSFVFAAILTPPDPITQTMLGAPLYILFEVSIWLSRILGYGKKPPAEDEQSET